MRDWSNWPTISTYLAWAEAQGCQVDRTEADPRTPDGYRLAKIVSPHGQALMPFIEVDERLMSTMVAHLDRRLGMKSRLFV